jgi:hypothetical protein
VAEDVKEENRDSALLLELFDRIDERLSEREASREAALIDKIETRMDGRVKSRNRVFAIGLTIVTLLSSVVIKQIIDSAASNAVDAKIADTKKIIDSTQGMLSLTLMAYDMAREDSFSQSYVTTVMSTLHDLENDKAIQMNPQFADDIEKIIDAFSAVGEYSRIPEICDLYNSVCMSNDGIVQSLLISYGRQLLSTANVDDEAVEEIYRRFSKAYDHSKGYSRGLGNAYKAVWVFKSAAKRDPGDPEKFVAAITHMKGEEAKAFSRSIYMLSDQNRLSKAPSADDFEIARTTGGFIAKFRDALGRANLLRAPTESESDVDADRGAST